MPFRHWCISPIGATNVETSPHVLVREYLVAYAPDEKPLWVVAVMHGRRSEEIAATLNLSPETISHHRKNICRKLDLHSTASLEAYGVLLLADEI
jgi:DNA-binding NarL/FixJ family response regulator